jgi:hypothetical protein
MPEHNNHTYLIKEYYTIIRKNRNVYCQNNAYTIVSERETFNQRYRTPLTKIINYLDQF